MSRDALIRILSVQRREGDEPDESELVTDGTLEEIAGGWRFGYDESELTGMEGTHTSFDVFPDYAVLTRTGTLSSQMIFEVGRPHTSFYELPIGALTVDVHTLSLRSRLGEHGGLLELRYDVSVEHEVVGENSIRVRIKTKDRGIVL